MRWRRSRSASRLSRKPAFRSTPAISAIEIEFILRDVGARALVVSRAFVGKLQPVADFSATTPFVLGIERDSGLDDTLEQLMALAPATAPGRR